MTGFLIAGYLSLAFCFVMLWIQRKEIVRLNNLVNSLIKDLNKAHREKKKATKTIHRLTYDNTKWN